MIDMSVSGLGGPEPGPPQSYFVGLGSSDYSPQTHAKPVLPSKPQPEFPHPGGGDSVVWGSRKCVVPVFPIAVGIGTRRHKRGREPVNGFPPCLV